VLLYSRFCEVDSIETALRRVSSAESDGFLSSAISTDLVLARLRLANIVRTPYRSHKSKVIQPKEPAGNEFNENST
jgi:hypothetical protein